jgi:ribonuclease BN (tRNA processing enzyme)
MAQTKGIRVKITLLPSAVSAAGQEPHQFLTSFLINGTVAIDAGSLGFCRITEDQSPVRHVLITHTHMDHIASLPIFLENVFDARRGPVIVHAGAEALDSLQRDLFNDRLWPDFVALTTKETPFLKLSRLDPGKPIELEGLRFTPVPVNHVVPTLGFLVEDESAAVVIPSDTGPTEEIWERANRLANLKAVFLEATFPDAMAQLADVSKHLTAATFAQELKKLKRPAAIYAVHIKARFCAQVIRELKALNLPNLEIGQFGKVYEI